MNISLQFPTAKNHSIITPHHGVIFYNFAGRARPIAIHFHQQASSSGVQHQHANETQKNEVSDDVGEDRRIEDDVNNNSNSGNSNHPTTKIFSIPVLNVKSFQSYSEDDGSGHSSTSSSMCGASTLASCILHNVFEYHLHHLSTNGHRKPISAHPSIHLDGDSSATKKQFVEQLLNQTSLFATMECQDCRPPPPPTAASVRRQYTSPHRQVGSSPSVSLFRPFTDQHKAGSAAYLAKLNAFISRKLGSTRNVTYTADNKQKEIEAIAMIEKACLTRSKAALRKGVVLKGVDGARSADLNKSYSNKVDSSVNSDGGGGGGCSTSAPGTSKGGRASPWSNSVEKLLYHTSPFSYCRVDEISFHTSIVPNSTEGANALSNAVYVRDHYLPMSVFDAAHLYKYCSQARAQVRKCEQEEGVSTFPRRSGGFQEYFMHNEIGEPSTPLQALQCAYSFSTRKVCPVEIHIDSLSGTQLWTSGSGMSSFSPPSSSHQPASPNKAATSPRGRNPTQQPYYGVVTRRHTSPIKSQLLPISHPPPSLSRRSSYQQRSPSSETSPRRSQPNNASSHPRIRNHPLLSALTIGRVIDHMDFTIYQDEPNERLRIQIEEAKCLEIIHFEFSRQAFEILSNERAIRTITGLQGGRYKRRYHKDFTSPISTSLMDSNAADVFPPGDNQKEVAPVSASGLIAALSFGTRRKTAKRPPTPQELRAYHKALQSRHKSHK